MHSRSLFIALLISGTGAVALAADPAPAATKIAVFDFELEDGSAGASLAGDSGRDEAYLKETSAGVRKLLEESGRYRLVDAGGADAEAVRSHSLHNCDGCDAAIALGLGAEQSLVGVVKRITRTEYVVGFQVRDAKTGNLLSRHETDLQMGANYSWSRGAVRLVREKLFESDRITPPGVDAKIP
jgi:hypothetical protein